MDILFLSPGYPAEMPLFVRGLAQVGARVWGVGDQPKEALPEDARKALSGYLPVKSLWDEEATIGAIQNWLGGRKPDKIECLWEPGMILAAKLREHLGVAGPTVAQTTPLRDKVEMKKVLEAAGVRVPRHGRARGLGLPRRPRPWQARDPRLEHRGLPNLRAPRSQRPRGLAQDRRAPPR